MVSAGRDLTDLLLWDLSTCSSGLSFIVVGDDHHHSQPQTHLVSCSLKSCQLLGVLGGLPGVSWAQEIPLHAVIPPHSLEHSCASASAADRSSLQKPTLLPLTQSKPWHSNTIQHFKTNPDIFILSFFLGHLHRLLISPVMSSALVLNCSVQIGQKSLV